MKHGFPGGGYGHGNGPPNGVPGPPNDSPAWDKGLIHFPDHAPPPGSQAHFARTVGRQGLIENWHRIYDSVTGRYLRVDPVRVDHASYRYVDDRPVDLNDPIGLDAAFILRGNRLAVLVDAWQDGECCEDENKPAGTVGYGFAGGPKNWDKRPDYERLKDAQRRRTGPFYSAGALDPSIIQGEGSAEYYCTDCRTDKKLQRLLPALAPNWSSGQQARKVIDELLTVVGITEPCDPNEREKKKK